MNHSSMILKRPLVSEKSLAKAGELARYVFDVDRSATKPQIRHAIEAQFGVRVRSVNTSVLKGKSRRIARSRARYELAPMKKAFVTLAPKQTIELLEVKT